MNCKDIWDTRSEKTKKRKCRSAESSFQVNLSKMINLSLLYAACWRTSDDPFVSGGLIHDLFPSFKATTSTSSHSCLGVGHLCVRSLILPERLLFIVLTNSEMKYRPWQHTYLYQVARAVCRHLIPRISMGYFCFMHKHNVFLLPDRVLLESWAQFLFCSFAPIRIKSVHTNVWWMSSFVWWRLLWNVVS